MADLIEREKVLEILRIIGHGRPISGKRAISLISEMPSASMWIPCSERLPEQGERVIVAIFGSDMIMPNEGETLQDAIERSRKEGYITVGFIGSDGWYGADWFPLMVHPSYWMTKPDLPEPPKE